jgi:chromosome segregation ATPase
MILLDLGGYIARANAEQKRAEAEIQKLSEERHQVLLERRSREAEGARQEAQQAKARTEQLQQELGELKARQTDRGLVVTLGADTARLFNLEQESRTRGNYLDGMLWLCSL